jgi:hypothetical protein
LDVLCRSKTRIITHHSSKALSPGPNEPGTPNAVGPIAGYYMEGCVLDTLERCMPHRAGVA